MKLTDEQISGLNKHPKVKNARSNRITFTYEFRVELYELWEKSPSTATLRKALKDNGIDASILGPNVINDINKCFHRSGYPSRGRNKIFGKTAASSRTPEDNEKLLETGKFVRTAHGIRFAPDFVEELYRHYPEQSVEDGIIAAGLAPEMVGYQRIYQLKRVFEGSENSGSISASVERKTYPPELRERFRENPFVKKITEKQFVFSDAFFNVMSTIRELHINEILDICGVDPDLLTVSTRNNLHYKLLGWETSAMPCFPEGPTELMTSFYKKYSQKLAEMVDDGFRKITEQIPAPGSRSRREFMMAVRDLGKELNRYFSMTGLLRILGISRNCFYSILKNERYGTTGDCRREQDIKDAEAVRKVLEYRGIKKGSRQIHMQMRDLTGIQLSLKKIRRLMKEFGMGHGIRRSVRSRKAFAEMVKKQKKPNLVKRRFRLHRPGELVLTDVTYLKYGDGKTAYGSAVMDPVTGKLLCFNVSANNDLSLVMESLDRIGQFPVVRGALLHSDQGTLYMTGSFQGKVAELGYIQSMSRRGNCWDNSPQESFFSHFKSECTYSHLKTVEELAKELENYADYWNNERKQWNRKRMTPVQYEMYMNSLSEAEFASYLENEEERYREMKERSIKKAVERAKCLGVQEDSYGKTETAS